MKRLRPAGRRGRTCCYPSIMVNRHENQEYQHVGQIEKEHGSKSNYKNTDNARKIKTSHASLQRQEDSVGKGPLAVQLLRHAAEMQGKKVWAKISAEEKSLSLVCSAQFAFHTRKQQHHIEFGLNQVLKNVHDSKLSLELIILCVVSPFQSLWFLKTFRVALIAFIEVQYQN